jgi:hypothetical protein
MLGVAIFGFNALAAQAAAPSVDPFVTARATVSPSAPYRSIPAWRGLRLTLPPAGAGGDPGVECTLRIVHARPEVDANIVHPIAHEVDSDMVRESGCSR